MSFYMTRIAFFILMIMILLFPLPFWKNWTPLKKGHDQLNFHAREFIRLLDTLPGEKLVTEGASIGQGLGNISILTNLSDEQEVKEAFVEQKPDHRILSAALFQQKK